MIREQFKGIDIKFRAGVMFGVLAFVISVFAGMLAGNTVGQVLMRSLLFTGLFIIFGIAVIFVIERFVPEVLERYRSEGADAEAETQMTVETPETEASDSSIDESEHTAEDEDTVPLAVSFPDEEMDEYAEITREGKLGKHIIKNEKTVKYEPRIMAEAIRTMLKRDED